MARMPDFVTEIERDLGIGEHAYVNAEHYIGHLLHHGQSQAPATQPVSIEAADAAPQGGFMSLLDTIRQDVADVESKLGGLDEEALSWVNAITANPEAKAVMSDLAGLAQVAGLPAGAITGAATAIKTVLSLYPDAHPAAPAAPADPAPQPVA